jgi:hypothetical protein
MKDANPHRAGVTANWLRSPLKESREFLSLHSVARARQPDVGAPASALEPGWQLGLLARAIEPFQASILYVKGVRGTDEIARPLVRNFADWAMEVGPLSPPELLGKVLERAIRDLQQCFDPPIIFTSMLELFVKMGSRTWKSFSRRRTISFRHWRSSSRGNSMQMPVNERASLA